MKEIIENYSCGECTANCSTPSLPHNVMLISNSKQRLLRKKIIENCSCVRRLFIFLIDGYSYSCWPLGLPSKTKDFTFILSTFNCLFIYSFSLAILFLVEIFLHIFVIFLTM